MKFDALAYLRTIMASERAYHQTTTVEQQLLIIDHHYTAAIDSWRLGRPARLLLQFLNLCVTSKLKAITCASGSSSKLCQISILAFKFDVETL